MTAVRQQSVFPQTNVGVLSRASAGHLNTASYPGLGGSSATKLEIDSLGASQCRYARNNVQLPGEVCHMFVPVPVVSFSTSLPVLPFSVVNVHPLDYKGARRLIFT